MVARQQQPVSPPQDPQRVYRRRRAVAAVVALAFLALAVAALTSHGGGAHTTAKAAAPARAAVRHTPVEAQALSRAAEERAINHVLSYTPAVRAGGTRGNEVALTFDDGPGPYTPEILRVLVREHVPATFFEVGVEERYFHAATSQIVARGYPIGDHTESHSPMSQLKRKAQLAQLIQDSAAIGNYGAPFPRMFRPPYGMWDHTTLALLRQFKMLMVLWSVDTDDYERPGVKVIVQRTLAGLEPGAIILLHDAGGDRSQTVAALPLIIKALRKRGYKLVTVPRLLLDNPAPKDQDIAGLRGAGG